MIHLPEPTIEIPKRFFIGGPPAVQWNGDEFMLCWPRVAPAENWSSNAKIHHMRRAKLRRAWRDQAGAAAFQLGPLEGAWYIRVSIPFERNAGRRDPHNFTGTVVKSIIDGLVDGGVWPDDTPDYVRVGDPMCRVVGRFAEPMVAVHGWRMSPGAVA